MQRLDDSELSKPPSEVLEIICKLGKGSYGSVYKARYKANGGIVAVKKVPVDSDLADIVKEISIMQQCDSPFIVKCYGSLFDSQDLWICMEYCGAGSIADIMRLRGRPIPGEDQIATVLHYSLCGLDYLHQMRKIHRDIKAGNILLLNSGAAKLADFGVAGQLSDTLAKRNTVIGTPYWMAPEVIQEIGYNCSADIWSLGITAIEMADGKPPLADIHPMRALFMIPSQPAPALRKPNNWSLEFRSFVTACLAKSPESRPTASALLQTEFIRNAKPCSILLPLINEANEARERRLLQQQQQQQQNHHHHQHQQQQRTSSPGQPGSSSPHTHSSSSPDTPVADVKRRHSLGNKTDDKQNQQVHQHDETEDNNNSNLRTMVRSNTTRNYNKETGLHMDGAATLVSLNSNHGSAYSGDGNDSSGSFIRHDDYHKDDDEMNLNGSSGNLDTMVVNDAAESEEDSGSVVVHDISSSSDGGYDDNEGDDADAERDQREAFALLDAALPSAITTTEGTLTRKIDRAVKVANHNNNNNELHGQQDSEMNNDVNGNVVGQQHHHHQVVPHQPGGQPAAPAPFIQRPFAPFSRAIQQNNPYTTNDPSSAAGGCGGGGLNRLSYTELEQLLVTLTNDLEIELKNLAVRYRHKRQPLLDAIAEKTAQAGYTSSVPSKSTIPVNNET